MVKIAVTGATGRLGRVVIEQLKLKTEARNIIGLARSVEKGNDLGIEIREADYNYQESLLSGLNGVDRLLLISGSEVGKRALQHANIINAAKVAGVKWIVYTSLLHADNTTLELATDHIETERLLKESGIPFTLLRNGWYTENYTALISKAVAAEAYPGSAGDGKISSAARIDFAEAAATVICDEEFIGKTFELSGDSAYTLSDLANEISRQTGKNIPYKNFSQDDYYSLLVSKGVPEHFAHVLASSDVSASKGDLFDRSGHLSAIIGRPTTPLADVVAQTLKEQNLI